MSGEQDLVVAHCPLGSLGDQKAERHRPALVGSRGPVSPTWADGGALEVVPVCGCHQQP